MTETLTLSRGAARAERLDRRQDERHLILVRLVATVTLLLGTVYLAWRWLYSLNPDALWISVPLVLAETYSLIDVAFFAITVWRVRRRPRPPAPPQDWTVDVFIATYNEPIDLVLETAEAAKRIRYPHRTWVLDDGNRPELRDAVERLGIGYLTRGAAWDGHQRHAKAGNLNNAILATEGEFLLVLDADQVPDPRILDHTLGYFLDDSVAFGRRRRPSGTSERAIRSAATRPSSTAPSSRARTPGTPPSSAAPTRCSAARRSCSSRSPGT